MVSFPALPELVEDKVNGRVFQDSEELAKKLVIHRKQVTHAQQREREPEYTLEERADAKTGRRVLHLHIRLPAVSSQKELDVKFGLHRVVLVAEGKYRLDLSVQAKEKVPMKCRFVKKTKTLKIAFEA